MEKGRVPSLSHRSCLKKALAGCHSKQPIQTTHCHRCVHRPLYRARLVILYAGNSLSEIQGFQGSVVEGSGSPSEAARTPGECSSSSSVSRWRMAPASAMRLAAPLCSASRASRSAATIRQYLARHARERSIPHVPLKGNKRSNVKLPRRHYPPPMFGTRMHHCGVRHTKARLKLQSTELRDPAHRSNKLVPYTQMRMVTGFHHATSVTRNLT